MLIISEKAEKGKEKPRKILQCVGGREIKEWEFINLNYTFFQEYENGSEKTESHH